MSDHAPIHHAPDAPDAPDARDVPAVDAAATWTGAVDPTPLALYRVGFGALLCAESLARLPWAAELFSSEGFHRSSFRVPVPPPAASYALVALSAAAGASLALGWQTRASAAVSLALWAWLHMIDQINERALHTLVLVVLALLCLSDAGAARSLDARRRGEARAVWATPYRLLQLQFAQVYFFAGVAKMYAQGWVTGHVLLGSLSSRWATPAGLWVASWIPDEAWRGIGLATILYELLAPWLLFVPWARPWVVAVGLGFHVGIQVTLGVGWLGPHFILALLTLFQEPATLRRAIARLQPR